MPRYFTRIFARGNNEHVNFNALALASASNVALCTCNDLSRPDSRRLGDAVSRCFASVVVIVVASVPAGFALSPAFLSFLLLLVLLFLFGFNKDGLFGLLLGSEDPPFCCCASDPPDEFCCCISKFVVYVKSDSLVFFGMLLFFCCISSTVALTPLPSSFSIVIISDRM